MSEEEDQRSRATIQRYLDQLSAQFSEVHIFVSQYEPTTGQTRTIDMGAGNWYARYGLIKEWITRQEEATRISEHAIIADDQIEDDDDAD